MKYNVGDKIRVLTDEEGNSLNGKIVKITTVLLLNKGYLIEGDYFVSEDDAYPPITEFHVGDMVKVFDGREIEINEEYPKFTDTMEKYIGNIYKVSKVSRDKKYVQLEGVGFFWSLDFSPSWLGLVESANIMPKYEINIISDGEHIKSSFKEGDKVISTISTPVDESLKFTYENSIGEWCDKLFKKKEEVFNGKVVCVNSSDHELTKGNMYEFKNGFAKFDNGTTFPSNNPIKNLKDLNDRVGSKFEMYDKSKLNGKFVYIGVSSYSFTKGKIYTIINSKTTIDMDDRIFTIETSESELKDCFVRLVED